MKIILALFSVGFMLIASCGIHYSPSVGGSRESEPIPSSNLPELEAPLPLHPVTSIELIHRVKDSDTTALNEILCNDSVLFTEVLNEINPSQLCIEFGIEGATYFSATTNKKGEFAEVNVLKSLGDCSAEFEDKVKEKILSMGALEKEYRNTEIIFCHRLTYR